MGTFILNPMGAFMKVMFIYMNSTVILLNVIGFVKSEHHRI